MQVQYHDVHNNYGLYKAQTIQEFILSMGNTQNGKRSSQPFVPFPNQLIHPICTQYITQLFFHWDHLLRPQMAEESVWLLGFVQLMVAAEDTTTD